MKVLFICTICCVVFAIVSPLFKCKKLMGLIEVVHNKVLISWENSYFFFFYTQTLHFLMIVALLFFFSFFQ